MPALKELVDQRVALAKQNAALLTKATEENRHLSAEESQEFDKRDAEVESLGQQIKDWQDHETRIQRQAALAAEMERPVPRQVAASRPNGEPAPTLATEQDRVEALRAWLLMPTDKGPSEAGVEAARRCGLNLNGKFLSFRLNPQAPQTEKEALAGSVSSNSGGGYTVPNEMMRALEVALLRFGGMRQVSTIIRTDTGASLPLPTVNDTGNKGEIIGENSPQNSQDFTFGQVVLGAYKYSSKLYPVSIELLQDSSVNIPQFVGQGLGTRLGRIQNDHFTTGTGSSQPKGVVAAATSGKVGATGQTTSIVYVDLVDLFHAVDPSYRENAQWMMHDTSLRNIKKIVDSQNRPLWSPGLVASDPDTLMGRPYIINQSVAVMAANAKSVLFGDFSKYVIRDALDITLQRLDERYAELGQVAFLAFQRSDGNLLDAGTHPVQYYANSAT